jgi:hypothetical protein
MTDQSKVTSSHRENIAWNLRLAEAVDNDQSWLEQQLEPNHEATHRRPAANAGSIESGAEHDGH